MHVRNPPCRTRRHGATGRANTEARVTSSATTTRDGSHRIRLPEFTDSIRFAKTGGLHIATRTDDRRAPVSEDGSGTRNAGTVVTLDPAPCNQTMTVDIRNKHDGPYRLALYFVDWEKTGPRSAVEVFDLDDKRLLMPVQIVPGLSRRTVRSSCRSKAPYG